MVAGVSMRLCLVPVGVPRLVVSCRTVGLAHSASADVCLLYKMDLTYTRHDAWLVRASARRRICMNVSSV